MTLTDNYPRVIRPEMDFLEVNAALGAIITAENVAEATIISLRERGGDTEDVETHLMLLIRAELGLRAAADL